MIIVFFSVFSNEKYFSMKNKLLHVTSKFCGKDMRSKSNLDYFKRITVPLNVGKSFKIKIIGFSVTESTIGAQIDLYDDLLQLSLWDNEFTDVELNTIFKKTGISNQHLKTGSRAHITIGLAKDIKPVQTGFDLYAILLMMKSKKHQADTTKPIQIDNFKIFYLGNCSIYIELIEPIYLDSIFSFGFR
jgi:hypothetical protein